jgi:nitric oxide reductase NorE protein
MSSLPTSAVIPLQARDGGELREVRLPGDRDVWFFICAELMLFSAFFVAFMGSRAHQVALFDSAQLLLDWRLGALNTMVMITSSWAVAWAVGGARRGRLVAVPHLLEIAIALGAVFLGVKIFEYSAKFSAGITVETNDFFMFYFILTMIHAAHVVAGSVILAVLRNNARAGYYGPGTMKGLEAGASYWHMVDVLWLFLFSLLYLLR